MHKVNAVQAALESLRDGTEADIQDATGFCWDEIVKALRILRRAGRVRRIAKRYSLNIQVPS